MSLISQRVSALLILILPIIFLFSQPVFATEESTETEVVNERADVLKTFHGSQRGGLTESYEEQQFQHKVMFVMGVALLLFVFLTAGFGIAMAMKGKDVFVPHMISAGVTVFLSVAHAVVAIVWFYPFK